ncbi:MAG TPA: PCRF domain-containing protein [Phycisphaerales bacterium]|nr:PCRF domain-containing protein [Phycisphaerales bacterium]
MLVASQNVLRKLHEMDAQFSALSDQLLDPAVLTDHRKVRDLSIKKSALEPIVTDFRQYQSFQKQIADLNIILSENADRDLAALAREELPDIYMRADLLLSSIQKRLITAEDQSVGSVILEVRPGVGGDEAALWAGDLVNIYIRYAAQKKYVVEELQVTPAELGGFKLFVCSISGPGVWSNLGYEGGTHQVKRIPATEAQGRVHTSTATVAILPEPEEVEVRIAPDDVKEIITTAQGPGGQNVNKVSTAVHLIHLPTGIEVRMQETKSQGQNRTKAWQLLRARLYERQRVELHAQRSQQRNAMIGSADRAEKIRTYRYKENLVVDHRLEGSAASFNLAEVLAGNLQPIIDQLIERDTAERLAAL